jgi:Flp pilus assembly protein TadG
MTCGRSHPTVRERGQVVVLFALLLPVMLGMGSIVIAVGNWYVHKKHLQTLVDAGALGSGLAFTGCYQTPQTNTAIADAALAYAGDPNRDPATQNKQLQEPYDVHVVLNSNVYWDSNPYPADNTLGLPCDLKSLDVKATDQDVPNLFKWLPATPSPKARAKVEIRKVLGLTGMLPWAVPEVEPEHVAAIFVNENTGAIVGKGFLPGNNVPAPPPDLSAFNNWYGDVAPVNLNGNENFNTIIMVSRDPAASLSASTLAEICNQNPVQTTCYGKPFSGTSGLSFIHSYSDATLGAPDAPKLREVPLTGGCATDLAAPYFNLDGEINGVPCSIGIQAKIDFGPTGDPTDYPECAVVTAAGSPMIWSAGGIGGAYGTWSGSITPGPASGRNAFAITWETDRGGGDCNGPKNNGSFPTAGAPYVYQKSVAGPVQYVSVTDNANPGTPANSINQPTAASLHVTVGLLPELIDSDPYAPPIRLRFGSPSGSQNQALDCDKNINFKDEILAGCQNPYTENIRNGDCSNYNSGNLPLPPVGPFPGDDCMRVETGDKTGQLAQALDEGWGRNGGTTCQTLNNWPNNASEPFPDPFTDPRFVTLFISDESSFNASGGDIYPVRRFAAFYMTAADGLNCPGDVTAGGVTPNKDVWGHFVTYVRPGAGATPSDELCAFTEADVCIPVLVE